MRDRDFNPGTTYHEKAEVAAAPPAGPSGGRFSILFDIVKAPDKVQNLPEQNGSIRIAPQGITVLEPGLTDEEVGWLFARSLGGAIISLISVCMRKEKPEPEDSEDVLYRFPP